jgi:hypothetical protein
MHRGRRGGCRDYERDTTALTADERRVVTEQIVF